MDRRTFVKDSLAGLSSTFLLLPGASAQALVIQPERARSYDVVVYEGTPAGVMAAVAAARAGAKVALLVTGDHLGGMLAGGLCFTDSGVEQCIGGLSLEFFQSVAAQYDEKLRVNSGLQGSGAGWNCEPHVAEAVFRQMAEEAGVSVWYRHRLKEHSGVTKNGTGITEIVVEDGTAFPAKVFIDASYEGDLLAQAGCSYTVGREGKEDYGESLAGVQPTNWNHTFKVRIPAFDSKGKLLPEIGTVPRGAIGAADKKVPAYNFRLCICNEKRNQVPFPKPPNYDPERYALLARLLEALTKKLGRAPRREEVTLNGALPNHKEDLNNKGAFSTDYIGGSWNYPEASYQERAKIWQDHYEYLAGFLYYLSNDVQVPKSLQDEMNKWGLAKDEFVDSSHWPFQLYVREARRLKGDFVLTQKDVIGEFRKHDVIGLGSYTIDSHNVQRYVTTDGFVQNEGNIEAPIVPYQIPFRVLLPKPAEVTNLLVPVCASASHVAYCPLRVEPIYMILGEAAGVAAKMAISSGVAVQDIDTKALTAALQKQGTVMEWSGTV